MAAPPHRGLDGLQHIDKRRWAEHEDAEKGLIKSAMM
jgi:hypothetical protein